MSKNKYTKVLLQEAVINSVSYAGVLRHVGLKQAGGTQSHITNMIRKFDIDTSHFTGARWNKGKTFPNLRKKPEEILVIKDKFSHRSKHVTLKRAMLESEVVYKCSCCGIGDIWNNYKIELEIDHKNGFNWDDRLENLRFICPNCHSQQSKTNRPHKYAEVM